MWVVVVALFASVVLTGLLAFAEGIRNAVEIDPKLDI